MTQITTEHFDYDGPGGPFQGTISWDSDQTGPRPVVLIFPNVDGQRDFDTDKGRALAELGYLGIAVDVYGKGRRGETRADSVVFMNELNKDRPLLLARMDAALAAAKAHPLANATAVAAIGFCFGGKCVLDLARFNRGLRGVVSFHGVFDAPPDLPDTRIETPILIAHGWNDPLATPDQTVALCAELTAREADWQLHAFGGTGHAFTHPGANAPERGAVYHPQSNARSWVHMRRFLAECFNG